MSNPEDEDTYLDSLQDYHESITPNPREVIAAEVAITITPDGPKSMVSGDPAIHEEMHGDWMTCPDCDGTGFLNAGEMRPCKLCGTTGAVANPHYPVKDEI